MEKGEIILYQSQDGATNLDVIIVNETVWLTQTQMSKLFGRDRSVINRHIRNIFAENELEENVVCAKYAHTTQHGAIKDITQTIEILFIISAHHLKIWERNCLLFQKWKQKRLKF